MSLRTKSAEILSQAVAALAMMCMYILATLLVIATARHAGLLPEQVPTQCVCDCDGGPK